MCCTVYIKRTFANSITKYIYNKFYFQLLPLENVICLTAKKKAPCKMFFHGWGLLLHVECILPEGAMPEFVTLHWKRKKKTSVKQQTMLYQPYAYLLAAKRDNGDNDEDDIQQHDVQNVHKTVNIDILIQSGTTTMVICPIQQALSL